MEGKVNLSSLPKTTKELQYFRTDVGRQVGNLALGQTPPKSRFLVSSTKTHIAFSSMICKYSMAHEEPFHILDVEQEQLARCHLAQIFIFPLAVDRTSIENRFLPREMASCQATENLAVQS